VTDAPVVVDWHDGRPLLPAASVARAFDMTEAQLRTEMAAGHITSLVERGEAEDAGCWRLTLRWRGQVRCLQVGRDGLARPAPPPQTLAHAEPALFRMVAATRTGPARSLRD